MSAVAGLGFWNLILPLFFWVPLFALAAGLLGLSTVRRARKQLVAAQRPTRLPIALIGIFLLVLMPMGAGFLGGTFAFKRGVGKLIEKGGEQVVGWSVTRGASHMQAALGIRDGHEKVHARDLQALIAAQLAGSQHADTLPAARIGSPLVAALMVPQLLERAFWIASDKALSHYHGDVSWDELVVAARLALHVSSHQVLTRIAEQFHAAALVDLIALGVLLVLAHALALLIVWFLCRRRLTVET